MALIQAIYYALVKGMSREQDFSFFSNWSEIVLWCSSDYLKCPRTVQSMISRRSISARATTRDLSSSSTLYTSSPSLLSSTTPSSTSLPEKYLPYSSSLSFLVVLYSPKGFKRFSMLNSWTKKGSLWDLSSLFMCLQLHNLYVVITLLRGRNKTEFETNADKIKNQIVPLLCDPLYFR